MTKHFAPFWADFETTSDKHVRLLSHFETYLSALSAVRLHPALSTDDRKTLYDCIPVAREREWATQCEQSHAHVRAQVLRLQRVHDEICRDVSAIAQSQATSAHEYSSAVRELTEMRELAAEQGRITGQLSDNLAFVMSQIAHMSQEVTPSSTMFASSNALEVCRGIDELYQRQHDMVRACGRGWKRRRRTLTG